MSSAKPNTYEDEWSDQISECPVYYPSLQEFDDPFLFLQNIALQASKYGICKIVSPVRARVPADIVLTREIKDFKFETTVQPLRDNNITFFRRGRKYKFREFERLANKVFLRHCSGILPSPPCLEKEFWRQISLPKNATVEYAINVEGTAFSSDPTDHIGKSKWNLKHLSRLPKSTLRFLEGSIPGITDPMLYIGMIFSMFAWHVEDHYLYSINYHHFGAPKTWYGVPADFFLQFEKVVLDHIYSHDILSDKSEDGASKILAEKTTMFSPKILLQNKVPVYKVVQKPGEFVITFPKAYHAGFSHGFNCGEAVNFAMSDWFQFGEEARQRYALLRIVPIIPVEELLCKEAMLLYQHSLNGQGSVYSPADFSIKPCFVRLIKFYEQALQRLSCTLIQSSSVVRPILQGTIICQICKQDCYLAYMSCNCCHAYSICLNHVWDTETEWVNCCNCGSKISVVVREDMSAYMVAAQKFEQETNASSVDNDNKSTMTSYNAINDERGPCSKTYLAGEGRRKKGKSNMKTGAENNGEVAATRIRRMKGLSQIHSKL